jgi:hypothetical protein
MIGMVQLTYAVDEVTSGTSQKVTLERGDFTVSDFGGSVGYTGQKSVVDTDGLFLSRWTKTLNGSATATLASNVLALATTTTDTPARLYLNIDSTTADFVMTVDISGVLTPVSASSHDLGWLSVTIGANTYEGGVYNSTGIGGSEGFTIAKNQSPTTYGGTDESSGTATITRVGTNLNIDIGTINQNFTIGAGDALTSCWLMADSAGSGRSVDIDFTNFYMTSGGVELVQKRVLCSENDILKYAFDDTGDDVDNVSLQTQTTSVNDYLAKYQDIDVQAPTGVPHTFTP